MSEARPYIGGQAVLEGVMMRAPSSFAVVVRRKDGSLSVRERAMVEGPRGMRRWPLIRGVMSLVESLKLGGEALRFSVDQMEKDLSGAVTAALSAFTLTVLSLTTRADGEAASSGGGGRKAGAWLMGLVAFSFFIALPQALAAAANRLPGLGLQVQSPGFQAITGGFKLAVVLGYLLAIRRVPDILRVFQYHGAEHKTISTYEAGEALTVDNARAKTTLHPRCGTTFLVMVVIVSILVFIAVGAAFPRIATGSYVLDQLIFLLEKLPFIVPIAAVTFEIQRFFARYCTRGPLRALLWPGFLVQKITTAEPDDDQLEVALASLRVTLFRQAEGAAGQGGPGAESDVSFPTYAALLAAPRLRAAA
jgi:uncharacterized protein YqhQ